MSGRRIIRIIIIIIVKKKRRIAIRNKLYIVSLPYYTLYQEVVACNIC
jgi:hypothetical protein